MLINTLIKFFTFEVKFFEEAFLLFRKYDIILKFFIKKYSK
jgi:hypothetical protein